jgi:hypothetical protein
MAPLALDIRSLPLSFSRRLRDRRSLFVFDYLALSHSFLIPHSDFVILITLSARVTQPPPNRDVRNRILTIVTFT